MQRRMETTATLGLPASASETRPSSLKSPKLDISSTFFLLCPVFLLLSWFLDLEKSVLYQSLNCIVIHNRHLRFLTTKTNPIVPTAVQSKYFIEIRHIRGSSSDITNPVYVNLIKTT
ncbi:hypothetical protein PNOK_0905300 [Pyrrhoderma noxium]|uniref:Uncharacterized protein n=1 Tax=Pyrrhoderma noxium TaxID=2282107 RepID=A0A286U6V9_9AGAM|nr:hypothetical protein PNOK_0905300 [Pyrrhoderma noxium]